MSNHVINGLGSYGVNNAPINGFGAEALSPRLVPSSGDVNGGTLVNLLNTYIDMGIYNDTFDNSILNPVLWTDTSVSGTVLETTKLSMSVPASGGTARITSVYQFINADCTFAYSYTNNNFNRRLTFNHLVMSLVNDVPTRQNRVDARSYWDPTYGYSLSVELTISGVTTVLGVFRTSKPARKINMARHGGQVAVSFDDTYKINVQGWNTNLSNVEIYTSSAANILEAPHVITSNSFTLSPVILFGDAVAAGAKRIGDRITCYAPKSMLPIPVTVSVLDLTIPIEFDQEFTFTPDNGRMIDTYGKLIIDNDSVLRE